MIDFIVGFLCQLVFTVGIIALFGSVIAGLRHAFCLICGRYGHGILLATGIIGTPIHELSHALMCVIFGHKIKEIKLYQPSGKGGALGYVTHTYSKKNIYHQIGNFFIGTAPIVIGSGSLMLAMSLLLPDAFELMMTDIEGITEIGDFFPFIWEMIEAMFFDAFGKWQTWVFLILAVMISSHMEMSGADIKGSLGGLGILSLLWIISSGIIFLVSDGLFEEITSACASFALILSAFFSIAIIFLLIMVVLAFMIKLITSPFRR